MIGEEDSRKENRDRQPRAATHERRQQAGQHPVAPVGHCPRGVDGRHGAAEADHQRQKATAVQPDAVHQPIHDERAAGHVARIFQHRQREVERQQHGHKSQHAAHPGDDAVDNERGDPTLAQPQRAQPDQRPTADRPAQHAVEPIDPRRRKLSRDLEHQPHRQQENGDAQAAVNDHVVDTVREGGRGRPVAGDRADGQLVNPGVAPVGNDHV